MLNKVASRTRLQNHSDKHVFTDPHHDPSRPPAKATPVALLSSCQGRPLPSPPSLREATPVALLPSCQGRPLPSPPSLRKAEGRNALSLNVTCNM